MHILSIILAIIGITGMTFFIFLTGITFWRYQQYPVGSFRWHLRNQQLKHISAIACFFFMAMTASYTILLDAWAFFYFIIAFKIATWWLRLSHS